jgi:hypothetical protein
MMVFFTKKMSSCVEVGTHKFVQIWKFYYEHVSLTWVEWAIAMHGRYESPVLLILFTHICYVHSIMFL